MEGETSLTGRECDPFFCTSGCDRRTLGPTVADKGRAGEGPRTGLREGARARWGVLSCCCCCFSAAAAAAAAFLLAVADASAAAAFAFRAAIRSRSSSSVSELLSRTSELMSMPPALKFFFFFAMCPDGFDGGADAAAGAATVDVAAAVDALLNAPPSVSPS